MADKKISALTAATTPLAGTEVLPIVQSGATVKVAVSDLTAGRAISATSVTTGLGAVGTPAYTFAGDTNTGIWSPAADTIAFSEGGAEAARFDASGNFLVNTTDPDANQGGSSGTGMQFSVRAGFAIRCSMNDVHYWNKYSAGNLFNFNCAGVNVGSISVTAVATAFNVASDARLKYDIVDAPDAADLIDAIQVRSFKWNVNASEQRYGFVAQELVEVAPEAVTVPADENFMMSVDYSKLVPMLVKEIQSLRARVAQLEGN